ncbi:hypothetical protein C8R45DRAFT_1037095 [Mycena sanguinolenta]|nr:hypothetical protein C8R45DRAFT_1037095 [Mycena sanguinolenta]
MSLARSAFSLSSLDMALAQTSLRATRLSARLSRASVNNDVEETGERSRDLALSLTLRLQRRGTHYPITTAIGLRNGRTRLQYNLDDHPGALTQSETSSAT